MNPVAKENKDPVVKKEFEPAANDREAFKAEDRRIQENGGPQSPNNYNKIESPGKKFNAEDAEPEPNGG